MATTGDDKGSVGKPDDEPRRGSGISAGPAGPPVERRSADRVSLVVPLHYQFQSILDFVDVQSHNISRSGMFIQTEKPVPLGTEIAFEFGLVDGFTLLKGRGRVVRVVSAGPVNGLGVEFLDLDDAMRRLIDRIVEVNAREGRSASVSMDFSGPKVGPSTGPTGPSSPTGPTIEVAGGKLRLVLSKATAPFFTANPLLNARVGGFFGPVTGDEDPPLGGVFSVSILGVDGTPILEASGKVVAKQDIRIGVRLTDADQDALARLRSAVAGWIPTTRK